MGPVAQQLHLEHFSQQGFVRLIDHVINRITPQRVIFGRKDAPPDSGQLEMYPSHVFDVPLSGEKHVICGAGQHTEHGLLHPGDVLYSPPLAWKWPVWDRLHELCCFVFTEKLIRVTYVELPAPLPDGQRPVCVCFYHTQLPPSVGIRNILHTLSVLAAEGDPENATVDLTRGLFRMARAQLVADQTPLMTKAQVTFQQVQQYLVENFGQPINRKLVARIFQLHPGYLSRLYQERCGVTFSHILQKLRMEHAALLLKETDFSIDEITVRCGYRSTTFFITAFRKYYGMSPGRFRCR
ncbi:MAG TPA: AraC family transcriptional regulator [Armatimonadota bacterium]|nr:AraC family transcriptional regulator [Armatimonadota bacterium]